MRDLSSPLAPTFGDEKKKKNQSKKQRRKHTKKCASKKTWNQAKNCMKK